MDLVIGVVIFGFVAVTFYSLVIIQEKPSVEDLQQEAESINNKLEASVTGCGQIIDGQKIDIDTLRCLYSQNITQFKNALDINTKFCLYLEDTNGRVYVVNTTTENMTGFGDSELKIGGTPCGQNING